MAFGIETTDDLVASIKRDLFMPDGQITFTDQQILSIAYEELLSDLVPLLLSMDEGWYRTQIDQTLTGGTSSYTLPKYSMFLKMYYLALVNNATRQEIDMERAELADRRYLGYGTQGFPTHAYLDHHHVELVPTPDSGTSSTYSLRFVYFRMPGKLVPLAAAAKVLSVNYGTGQVTYTAAPPATFTSSSTHDFYSSTAPFNRLQNAITATNLAANVQTFPAASVQTLAANDYVCIVDESVYPDIPYGLFTTLKRLTMHSLSSTQMDVQQSMEIEKQILSDARQILGSAPGNRFVAKYKKVSQWNNQLLGNVGTWRGRGVFP